MARGIPQPRANAPSFKLSAGGARFAWFAYSYCRQTKGKWGMGYGPEGKLGAPLGLEWYQLQWVSEMLKTKPSQWLTVTRENIWDQIEQWVLHDPKFGSVGGPRAYKEGYVQLAKKQGKSTVSSSLALYALLFDNEPGAEVYAIAGGKPQARIVFDQARSMALKSPLIADQVEIFRDAIFHPESESIFRVLAADSDYNEGLNPSFVVIDELHAHKNRGVYDALTSHLHTGAREDPFVCTITNAGSDPESVCFEVYTQAMAVIEGRPDARQDLYAFVPELTENELYDKTKWKKVAPASWTTIAGMEEAQRKFPEYVFQRRYLNYWTEAQDSWLPYEYWDDAEDQDRVLPKGAPIVVAADMGMSKDTTALAWAGMDEDGCLIVRSHIWGIRQKDRAVDPPCHELLKTDRFPIKTLRYFIADELLPHYQILEVDYDKWMMEQLAQELSDEGLNMVEFPQTDQRMIPASEDLWNAIVRDDILRHDGDPVLTKHVMAGVVDETGRGWRINKRRTQRACDGLVAMLMASHRMLYYHRAGTPSFQVI